MSDGSGDNGAMVTGTGDGEEVAVTAPEREMTEAEKIDAHKQAISDAWAYLCDHASRLVSLGQSANLHAGGAVVFRASKHQLHNPSVSVKKIEP